MSKLGADSSSAEKIQLAHGTQLLLPRDAIVASAMFKAKFQNVARNTKIQSWSKIAKIVKIEKNRDFDQL